MKATLPEGGGVLAIAARRILNLYERQFFVVTATSTGCSSVRDVNKRRATSRRGSVIEFVASCAEYERSVCHNVISSIATSELTIWINAMIVNLLYQQI